MVYNPVAGGSRGAATSELVERRLADAGYEVERHATSPRDGASQIVRAAADGADRVVAVGGDGTLREVVEGLAEARSRTVVGVVPMGNANIVARELGIPRELHAAIDIAAGESHVAMDLGRFRTDQAEGLFLAVVGVGWDADTVGRLDRFRRTTPGRKLYRLWADGLYGVAGVTAALTPGQPRVSISVDGGPTNGLYRAVFLSNLRTYGKAMSVTPDAHYASGLIHAQARKSALMPVLLWQLGAAMAGERTPAWISDYVEGRRIEVRGYHPFSVQVDGDARARTFRLEVEALPAAVRVLAPNG